MAYSSAVFYIDVENGSDAARSTLTGVVFSNPSSTTVLGTYAGHGLVTGAVIDVTGCTQAYANSAWKITYVSADTFTLDDALWASFTGADVTGNAVPRGGSSWTDAWRTTAYGATAARIQPGDDIRIAKSPDPVSTGITATFTNPPNTMDTAKSISASTNATPIVVTSNGHGLVNGDIVCIYDHATNLTANGVWSVTKVNDNSYSLDNSVGIGSGSGGYGIKANCKVLKMASALNVKTVTRCEVAWSPVNSPTLSKTTSYYKDGDGAVSFAKSSPSNSTLYAYFPVAGDFSAYQRLSFWFYPGTIINSTARWSVWLCTSADGTNPVDEFRIPLLAQANQWYPLDIAKEGGGNLSASVASIAIYSGTSAATLATSYFDCFVATKTNDINITSLVGKSSSAVCDNDPWFPIKSFSEDGTIIVLDTVPLPSTTAVSTMTSRGGGFYGTAGAGITLYRRETAKGPTTANTAWNWQILDSGTAGSLIKFTGGYNTSSGERDGDTWLEGWTGGSYSGIYISSRSYLEIDHINLARSEGFNVVGCSNITIKNFAATGCNNSIYSSNTINQSVIFEKVWYLANGTYGFNGSISGVTINEMVYCCNHTGSGIYFYNAACNVCDISATEVSNNAQAGMYVTGCGHELTIGNAKYNGASGNINIGTDCYDIKLYITGSLEYSTYGIQNTGQGVRVYGGTSANNSTSGVHGAGGWLHLHGFTPSDSTPYTLVAVGTAAHTFRDMGLYFTKYGTTVDDHRSYIEGATITYQKTVYHTPSTGAWKLSPTNAIRKLEYPVKVVLARVYCTAGKLVTVQCYACRDNTGIAVSLVCKKLQLAGIATNQIDSMTAAAGTWDADQDNGEQLEITFTPSEAGVVEIEGWAYGGTAYNAYFSNMTITQAD